MKISCAKHIKTNLLILFGAAVCFFFIQNFIISTISDQELKRLIQSEIKIATGYDLEIQGAVEISFGLTPTISLNDLNLSNPYRPETPFLLKVSYLEAHIPVWPLLWGHLKIEDLHLAKSELILETNQLGQHSWDTEPKQEEKTSNLTDLARLETDYLNDAIGIVISLTHNFDKIRLNDVSVKRTNKIKSKERKFLFSDIMINANDFSGSISFYLHGRDNFSDIVAYGTVTDGNLYIEEDAPIKIKLDFETKHWNFATDGEISPGASPELDLSFSFNGSSVRQVSNDLDDLFNISNIPTLPEKISFQTKGKLSGPLSDLSILNTQVSLTGSKNSQLSFIGNISNLSKVLTLDGKIDIDLKGAEEYGAALFPDLINWSHPWLSSFQHVRLEADLRSENQKTGLERIIFSLGQTEKLNAEFIGSIKDIENFSDLNGTAKINIIDRPELRDFLISVGAPQNIQDWPTLGEFQVESRIALASYEKLTLSDIILHMKQDESFVLKLDGVIHNPHKQQSFDLGFKINGQDTPLVRKVIKDFIPEIPTGTSERVGQFLLQGRAQLTDSGLAVQNIVAEFPEFHNTQVSAQGTWTSKDMYRFDFSLESKGADTRLMFKDTAHIFGQDLRSILSDTLESSPEVPFSVKSSFSIEPTKIQFSFIDYEFGKSQLRLKLSISNLDQRALFDVNISEARINLPDVSSLLISDQIEDNIQPQKKVFSQAPLSLALNGWDGRFQFNGNINGNFGSILDAVTLEVSIVDNVIHLSKFDAQTTNGFVSLQAHWSGNPRDQGRFSLDGKVENIEFGQLLFRSEIADWLTGAPLSAKIRGTSQGFSAQEIASNFNGKLIASLGAGTINNDTGDWLAGDILSQVYSTLNPFSKKIAKSDLVCMEGIVNFENGIASFKNSIGLETKRIAILASGKIDLGEEFVEIALASTPKEGLGITVGGSGNLARLSGPFSNMNIKLDEIGALKRGLSLGAAYLTGGITTIIETLSDLATGNRTPCHSIKSNQD